MEAVTVAGSELAGASALTAINENVQSVNIAPPRLDLLGLSLLYKLLQNAHPKTIFRSKTFLWMLAGDLLGNVLYYSLIGVGRLKGLWWRGTLLGFLTGLGSVVFSRAPKANVEYTTRTTQTKLMVLAWYLIGGLAASAVIRLMQTKPMKH